MGGSWGGGCLRAKKGCKGLLDLIARGRDWGMGEGRLGSGLNRDRCEQMRRTPWDAGG